MESQTNIVSDVMLVENMHEVLHIIDSLQESFYKANVPVQNLEVVLEDPVYAVIYRNMQRNHISLDDVVEIGQYLSKIKQELRNAKEMRITVGKLPTSQHVAEIYKQVTATFDTNILLDFQIDKQISGGVIIQYDGNYRDYSWDGDLFRRDFSEILLTNN